MKPLAGIFGLRDHFAKLRQHRFFSDRLSVGLLIGAVGLNLLCLAILLIKLRPVEFNTSVPVHYSNLNNGFDVLGPWYLNYRIVLFAALVTAVNTYLAIQTYSRSRIASFFLLTGSVVVAIFALIIAIAFTVVL